MYLTKITQQNSTDNPEPIDTLLIYDMLQKSTNLGQTGRHLESLSHKIQLIFNTLQSISSNITNTSDNAVQTHLNQAAQTVMDQLNEIITKDQKNAEKIIDFVKASDEEKLQLVKDKNELDQKLLEAASELKEVYEKETPVEQLEEDIEELNN